jgi:predicted double-glycine peptidase
MGSTCFLFYCLCFDGAYISIRENMRYFTFQGNDHDCGFAALKMLLCYAHHDRSYLRLAKTNDKQGLYSYRDLVEIGATHGVIITAYKLLDKNEIIFNKRWPILVSLINKNGGLHLVLLRKIKRGRVYIDDPIKGGIVEQLNSFLKRWDGSFLQIYKKSPALKPKKERPIVEIKYLVALCLLQSFSAFFALLGFAFVNQQNYFVFPLIFFSLFAIGEVIFRRFQLEVLARFDNNYLVRTYDEDKMKRKHNFMKFHDFKKNYFLFPQVLISSLIISFFVLMVLLFNDLLHLAFLGTLITLAFLELVVSQRFTKSNVKTLERIESETLEEDRPFSDILSNYKKMSQLSLYIAKCSATKKYISLFVICALALTYAAISGEATLNYFLFHFFIYLLFYENISRLFNSFLHINDLRRKMAAFKDQFVR